jgi:hypothetical protein
MKSLKSRKLFCGFCPSSGIPSRGQRFGRWIWFRPQKKSWGCTYSVEVRETNCNYSFLEHQTRDTVQKSCNGNCTCQLAESFGIGDRPCAIFRILIVFVGLERAWHCKVIMGTFSSQNTYDALLVFSSMQCPSEADSVTGQTRNQYHTGGGIPYLLDSRGELTVSLTTHSLQTHFPCLFNNTVFL